MIIIGDVCMDFLLLRVTIFATKYRVAEVADLCRSQKSIIQEDVRKYLTYMPVANLSVWVLDGAGMENGFNVNFKENQSLKIWKWNTTLTISYFMP